tara:strand:- start:15652 stop:16059 length:408 start_codon:yes stop_codon:yes gene_type:complete
MHYPKVTFVIDGKTYSVDAGDPVTIRNIPLEDRRHLINLLEAVKRQHSLSLKTVSAALDKSGVSTAARSDANATAANNSATGGEPTRLGSGDIDALMARLVVEEKQNRKPAITRSGIYKITAGFLFLILLLVIIA